MQCGIAVIPTPEIREFADSYRKRFDPYYDRISPHLTIREREDWSPEKLDAAAEHLERICGQLTPFPIRFNRFSSFYPAANVIYLALEDTSSMIRCYEQVCTGPFAETDKPYVYNPRLTIGRDLGDDELHDVLSSLRRTPVSLGMTVDRLHIVTEQEDGTWSLQRSFPFGGR